MGACPAHQQCAQRIAAASEKRLRQARRHDHSQRVAITAGIFGRDPARLPRDAHVGGAPFTSQRVQPAGSHSTFGSLFVTQIAEAPQKVGRLVGVARPDACQPLQLQLDLLHDVGVEEVAQLVAAK